jgi:uncharacterized protein YciI
MMRDRRRTPQVRDLGGSAMLFLRLCIDRGDSLDLRTAHRDDHRAYLASGAASIVQAGPLLNDVGEMIGSLIIVEADDIADVRRFHDDDPFTRAGLFETVLLSRWDKHIG